MPQALPLPGGILGRIAVQSEEERAAVETAGLGATAILTERNLVTSDDAYFAVTDITDGPILSGVHYRGPRAETHIMTLRASTRTRCMIDAEHLLSGS